MPYAVRAEVERGGQRDGGEAADERRRDVWSEAREREHQRDERDPERERLWIGLRQRGERVEQAREERVVRQ